jgi:hypothetical protein
MMIVGWLPERVFQPQEQILTTEYRGFIELFDYYLQALADTSLTSLLLATIQTKCALQLLSLS